MRFNELVDDERKRQDAKWGEQNHHPSIWLAILMEEVGEISSEIISIDWKPELQRRRNMATELIQTAAVCKVMYESLVRNGWIAE